MSVSKNCTLGEGNMLEDSISCSPGNDRKKSPRSRSRRFHKNTKRKSQRLSGASAVANTSAAEVPCLEALYEEESTATATQYEHFNPFESETILAAADMTVLARSSRKLNGFQSRGFVRLENLPVSNDNEENSLLPTVPAKCLAQPQSSVSACTSAAQAVYGTETQFGITESEFVRFCDEVETDVDSQPTCETKTPKAKKSIVDAILEDFCGSPYSESPPKFLVEECTPKFRFNPESITYSRLERKKPLRRNIVTELASAHLPEDADNAHVPSDKAGTSKSYLCNDDSKTIRSFDLSVEEELSQNVVDTVGLDSSNKVCEYLHNLNSYFSQLETHEKSWEIEESPLDAIVKDIMKLKRKPFTISRSKSMEEFHGFSDGDSDSNEDTLKNLLEDEDDVLQQINCDSLCYEKIVPKVSFDYNCSDIESALEGVDAVIEEANKLISSRSELNTEANNSSGKSQPNCDKHADILQNSSEKINDEQLFDDNDFWNDTECLLDYKTQKPHSIPSKPIDWEPNFHLIKSPSLNIDLENDKQIPITRKTSSNIPTSYKCKNEVEYSDMTASSRARTELKAVGTVRNPLEIVFEKTIGTSTCSTFLGFSTASRKPIAISEEANRKADEILKKFEEEEIEQRMGAVADVSTNVQEQDIASTTKKLTPEPVEETSLDLQLQGIRHTAQKSMEISSASTSLGFSTASRKPIAISEEAKRKADEILKKFEEEEIEQRMTAVADVSTNVQEQDIASTTKKLTPEPVEETSLDLQLQGIRHTAQKSMEISSALTSLGFSTASRKPIAISEEAKRKADEILKKFEEEEIEQRMAAVADVSTNVQEQDIASTTKKLTPEPVEETSLDLQLQGIRHTAQKSMEISSASTSLGFSTASRKPIVISEEAKRKADEILKKFEQEECEKAKPSEEFKKNNQEDDIPTSDLAIKIDNDPKEMPLQGFFCANKKSAESSTSASVGFATASRKPISISDEGKRKADEFLRNFEQTEKEERLQESKDLATRSRKIRKLEISEEIERNAQELLSDIEFFEEAFEEELISMNGTSEAVHPITVDCKLSSNNPIFDGFKTASKKSIQISEGAKRHADKILKNAENENLSQDFFKCIQADLNDLNPSHPAGSSIGREDQVGGASKVPTVRPPQKMLKLEKHYLHANEPSLSELNGMNFKKSVTFSEQVNADHLFRKMNKRNVLDVIKTAPGDDFNQTNPTLARIHGGDQFDKGTDTYSEDYEMIETLKRKRNEFYLEDLRKSPALISPRRLSCTERTPLNRIENAVLHKTSSLPSIHPNSKPTIISRRNLLSLSKRKKFNSPGRVDNGCIGSKTPDKVQHSLTAECNANTTPNLKEFFNSVSTSTPRLIRNGESKVDRQPLKDSSIDTDFQQINWEDANNSGRVYRTSSFTDPNVTCSEVSPSPKQRIQRLKMYGEPPPISPILMVNQCRPSGLRRGRSLMKP